MNLFDTMGETYTDTRQADERIVAFLVEYLGLSHGTTVADIVSFPLPPDLRENFAGPAWQKPECYLEEQYRGNISSFQKADPGAVGQGIARLADDLASGVWKKKHGAVLDLAELDTGYRFVYTRGEETFLTGGSITGRPLLRTAMCLTQYLSTHNRLRTGPQ